MLSAGSQGKSLWDSWEMSNEEKEDQEKVFDKFSSHLVGTQNKWVMRLELASFVQQEAESVEDFIWCLQSKANSCSFTENQKDDEVTFQLIDGIKWQEARIDPDRQWFHFEKGHEDSHWIPSNFV